MTICAASSHCRDVAAASEGRTVTAEVELVEIEGRALTFGVSCRDDAGLIGEGLHGRTIIDTERFMARVADKVARVCTANDRLSRTPIVSQASFCTIH